MHGLYGFCCRHRNVQHGLHTCNFLATPLPYTAPLQGWLPSVPQTLKMLVTSWESCTYCCTAKQKLAAGTKSILSSTLGRAIASFPGSHRHVGGEPYNEAKVGLSWFQFQYQAVCGQWIQLYTCRMLKVLAFLFNPIAMQATTKLLAHEAASLLSSFNVPVAHPIKEL